MSWRVIDEFADKTDKYHVYKAGDSFPRDGKQVDEKRIAELSTNKNAIKKPLIEEVVDERKAEQKPKRAARAKTKE